VTRAKGKHTERHVPGVSEFDEDPEARAVGASSRTQGIPSPIPGGRPHLLNAPSVRHNVPVADSQQEVRGVNAHGVLPHTHTTRERAEWMRGPNDLRPLIPHYRPGEPREPVVPVRIIQAASTTLRSAAPHHFVLNAVGGEPKRVCGTDPNRVEVLLLNEDSSSTIRFGALYGDLSGGGGALLQKSMTSYLRLSTQDELWAISTDSGTPTLSIIQVFDRQIV
jgi:hypothetical protein